MAIEDLDVKRIYIPPLRNLKRSTRMCIMDHVASCIFSCCALFTSIEACLLLHVIFYSWYSSRFDHPSTSDQGSVTRHQSKASLSLGEGDLGRNYSNPY